jgi:acetyl-CoA acyltransferase
MAKPSRPHARGPAQVEDTALGWRFVNPAMAAMGHTESLGETAENVAAELGVTREEQDRFAFASHAKATRAQTGGRFDDLVTVPVAEGAVDADEGPRADTSVERLARLRPSFRRQGTVTAGNSSPLSDGAAALVMTSADYAARLGLRPLARVLGCAVAGVEPRTMGLGPVPATRKLMGRLGLTLDDIDVIELNEAFAAQAVGVCRQWGIDPEDERLNPDGGAIALGHPLGCSGARLVAHLARALERRPTTRIGLATMCIGVGQGIAMALERA